MAYKTEVAVSSVADIVAARQKGRALAMELGFEGSELTMMATAISEIARNIVDHAKHGTITFSSIHQSRTRGILIVAKDDGPGIRDVSQAMQYGFSSRNGLGVGLPGAKWLMDDFNIKSRVGKGTVVTMKKWLHHDQLDRNENGAGN
ncbi:MAG TPA: anti-sigma regulatory factor [Candidatus Acidoferrum sp.]|nr:anti-sigma regulatory factor [Candidatus Acidoferrum sp.]